MSIQAINVRNQFKGIVTSVITTRSVDQLELKIGNDVVALVKSTEVSIAKL